MNKEKSGTGSRVTAVVSMFLLLVVVVAGPAAALPPLSGRVSSSDLTVFLDDLINDEMDRLDIPGAALVVVQAGELIFLEGYGFADRESGRLVDPVDTVFQIGSVSKPITSLAVHQQIEAALLAIEDPVSDYIDFDLPTFAGSEITVGSLLTHTSGLESPNFGISSRSADEIEPLGKYLARSVPGRFAPTGEVHSYSNWGYTLAGHIVEQTSGEAFDSYVEQRVFGPLGMSSSAFVHSMSAEIGDRMATGYSGKTGSRQPDTAVKYRRTYPAGGVATTASDMAPFMIALLDGAPGVVSQETTAGYLSTTYRAAPALPGRTQGGLEERFISGQRVVAHGGDIFTFSSQMVLLPDESFGFFLVYNAFSDEFRENITTAMVERLFPGEPQTPTAVELSSDQLAVYTGTYRWTRYVRGNAEKVVALTPPYNTLVSANPEGTLTVTFIGLNGSSWTYQPIGDHAFSKVTGEPALVDGLVVDPGDSISFTMVDGEAHYLNLALHTISAERVPFVLMGIPQLAMIGTIVILFAASLIIWPLGALVRSIRRKPHLSKRPRIALWLSVAVGVSLVGGFVAFFAGVSSDIVFGVPPMVIVATTLLSLAAIAGLALVPTAVLAWRSGWFTAGGRTLYTLLALTAPLTLWWVWYWNMLGYQF